MLIVWGAAINLNKFSQAEAKSTDIFILNWLGVGSAFKKQTKQQDSDQLNTKMFITVINKPNYVNNCVLFPIYERSYYTMPKAYNLYKYMAKINLCASFIFNSPSNLMPFHL